MAQHPIMLAEVLTNAEAYPSRESLFLPMDEVWTSETFAVVADLDEIDDPDSEAIETNGRRYDYALGLDTLTDIVINAREQVATPTAEQLLTAFLYYYDHDAFIEFERPSA